MEIKEIAKLIKNTPENIFLIYAFNGTGKTRLSKEYKDITKDSLGNHTGVYYNAFSEDLFRWNNDEENDNEKIRLEIVNSSLSPLHQYFGDENPIKDKLDRYKPAYDFRFKYVNDNQEEGIEYIWFFKEDNKEKWIKISRGEERIFIWCFFLALFEIEDFEDAHKDYIFIDDPVSSLDDLNVYTTAESLFNLFDNCIENNKKIIVTTHHLGLFSILCDWLNKGENAEKYKKNTVKGEVKNIDGKRTTTLSYAEISKFSIRILEYNETYTLKKRNDGSWLYHLLLLRKLKADAKADNLYRYHFGLLRQALEIIASFLGRNKRIGYVLNTIGENEDVVNRINEGAHKQTFDFQDGKLVGDNKEMLIRIVKTLIDKYGFDIK